jgi:chromosome segregation ATPase
LTHTKHKENLEAELSESKKAIETLKSNINTNQVSKEEITKKVKNHEDDLNEMKNQLISVTQENTNLHEQNIMLEQTIKEKEHIINVNLTEHDQVILERDHQLDSSNQKIKGLIDNIHELNLKLKGNENQTDRNKHLENKDTEISSLKIPNNELYIKNVNIEKAIEGNQDKINTIKQENNELKDKYSKLQSTINTNNDKDKESEEKESKINAINRENKTL